MKKIVFAFIVLTLTQIAWADVPTCKNIGTKSEGWYFRGQLIAWDQCAGQFVSQRNDKSANADCSSIRECLCQEICNVDCRIVNGQDVCDRSCETICDEV